MHSEKVVIIGSGCAGLAAAIYTARAQLNPLVISGDLPGGLLTQTTEIENFPGFPEKIQGSHHQVRIRADRHRCDGRLQDLLCRRDRHQGHRQGSQGRAFLVRLLAEDLRSRSRSLQR